MKPIQILINAKDNASSVFSSLQAKVAAVGAAIASYFGIQAFAGVIKGAADFEGALSRVKAATGASGDEMERLKKAAEDAGANTKFTSVEAANALENLAKAGLSAADSVEALPAVLNLAQAADVGLAESAEFVTKAVMGMGLQFSDAARVADVLALGANATNTSVTGLAQALSYAAPVAQSAGVSLEGTVAIMGKLADAGIDASRSGTAVANMLAQFSDPASAFKRALADAGITTNDFEQALHELAAAGPRGEKAILAVGLNAGPALRALLNQGMGALDELKGKLEGAAGSAEATAKVMQDNLNGSLTGLASAWDTVKNVLGTPVLPVLKEGVDQLAGAFRSAVADGTIAKFGESIATAFQNGLKWVREFIGSLDTQAITAKLQGWADEFASTMDRIGTYATNAGNVVKTMWGVMTAGSNTVLGVIYSIGEAFAAIAAGVQRGLATIMEGFAKVTFGDLSNSFKAAAEEIRLSAEATGAAQQALAQKATDAFSSAVEGAQLARDGWAGLTDSMANAEVQATRTSAAMASVAAELQKTADANAAATAAQQKKAQADADAKAAAEAHAQAIATMRGEYAQLVASGNLQEAAKKLEEINKALRETGVAGKDAAKAAQEAAKQVEAAFTNLGVTSSAALAQTAETFKRSYQTIRDSGTATARDLEEAFKKAAEAAINAGDGVAPSWVKAEAAVRGYRVEVDGAGKATLVAMKDGKAATDAAGAAARNAGAGFASMADKVTMAKEALRAMGIEAEQVSEKVQDLIKNGQMLAGAFQQRQDNWNRDLEKSKYMNRGNTGPLDQVPTFNSTEEAEVWKREWLAEWQRKNPFTTKLGGMGSYMKDTVMAEWEAEMRAVKTRMAMQDAVKKPDGGGTPGGGNGSPSVDRIVNLYINTNSRGYGVPTNQAGQQELEAFGRDFVAELANSKWLSGR